MYKLLWKLNTIHRCNDLGNLYALVVAGNNHIISDPFKQIDKKNVILYKQRLLQQIFEQNRDIAEMIMHSLVSSLQGFCRQCLAF